MASSRSIRFKISTLLIIPLVSLVGLWGFAAAITTGDSLDLLKVESLYDGIGRPGDTLVLGLQREHLLSAEYVATGTRDAFDRLVEQRLATDTARKDLRALSRVPDVQNALTPAMKGRYSDVMAAVEELDDLRNDIDTRAVALTGLGERFGVLPTAVQALDNTITLNNDVPLYQQSRSLGLLSFAKDFLARESALGAGVLVNERPFTVEESRAFIRYSGTRDFLFGQGMKELDPELRKPFEDMLVSDAYRSYIRLEMRIVSAAPVSHAAWRKAVDATEKTFREAILSSEQRLSVRAEPVAVSTFVRTGVAGVLGLIAVALSLFVSVRLGRGLTRELAALRTAARQLAEVRLPRVVERLRRGEKVDVAAEAPALEPPGTTGEVADVAHAFSAVQLTAVDAAVDQARLRESVGQALRNLARRSQGLLQRQLKLLDGMQRRTEDPGSLEELFRLDHLTTRMRRHAEGLIVLSGGTPGRTYRQAVAVAEMLQGAVGEVEDYTRVRVYPMPETAVKGAAVADLIHLFAELIENATTYSPPQTEVSVRGEGVAKGFAVEIEDRGLGLSPADLDKINSRLASPPEFDLADTDRLGLVVVGRLATRLGVRVELRQSPFGGTTAIVLIPSSTLAPEQVLEGVRA
ncbi:sensor histidine kinase [Herbidospora mongoliensis]|uniref:sensor histidine kinase n=1 Tax=Herbidospora mongoliensis TaxID=688067 RepID=UPI0008327C02|nr:nitrate- and nitrite sensing domain-containing protein [Herbidospora mongoliensis]